MVASNVASMHSTVSAQTTPLISSIKVMHTKRLRSVQARNTDTGLHDFPVSQSISYLLICNNNSIGCHWYGTKRSSFCGLPALLIIASACKLSVSKSIAVVISYQRARGSALSLSLSLFHQKNSHVLATV
jgi:hypothetical protein